MPAQVEFLADVGAMSFDRSVIDEKLGGDLFIGFIIGDQLDDAAFGRRLSDD